MAKAARALPAEAELSLRGIFHQLDTDGDGAIDQHQLRTALMELHRYSSEEDLASILAAADFRQNGKVELRPLIHVLRKRPPLDPYSMQPPPASGRTAADGDGLDRLAAECVGDAFNVSRVHRRDTVAVTAVSSSDLSKLLRDSFGIEGADPAALIEKVTARRASWQKGLSREMRAAANRPTGAQLAGPSSGAGERQLAVPSVATKDIATFLLTEVAKPSLEASVKGQ